MSIYSIGRFESIAEPLRAVGLWCFPISIECNADEHYDKTPLVKWKALQERPPTPDELETWRERFGVANAGIPTGPGTGVFVVDTDSPNAVEYLETRSDGMPETWLVRTRRGLHYYFCHPDFEVHNSAGAIATGVDIRGHGGYVVTADLSSGLSRPVRRFATPGTMVIRPSISPSPGSSGGFDGHPGQ
jgi:hypothetical protein